MDDIISGNEDDGIGGSKDDTLVWVVMVLMTLAAMELMGLHLSI